MAERVLLVGNFHFPSHGKPPDLKTEPGFYTGYFENSHAEQLIFRYEYKTGKGTLWHGDHHWEKPCEVVDGSCHELVLDANEREWLALVWRTAKG